jgi:hypothetical protein
MQRGLPRALARCRSIFTHGSDVGRNQLKTWSFSTEAHWLRSQPKWAETPAFWSQRLRRAASFAAR